MLIKKKRYIEMKRHDIFQMRDLSTSRIDRSTTLSLTLSLLDFFCRTVAELSVKGAS